eukprot:13532417-Ditylum_brightwellii.AAC.1
MQRSRDASFMWAVHSSDVALVLQDLKDPEAPQGPQREPVKGACELPPPGGQMCLWSVPSTVV